MQTRLTSSPAMTPKTSVTIAQRTERPDRQRQNFRHRFMLSLALSLLGSLMPTQAWANSPESAPPELKNALAQIDDAANRQNVQGVLQFYSPNFTHSDRLTRTALEQALGQLWKRYPNLKYRTELKSWEPDGKGLIAETVTQITGTQQEGDRQWKITSTLQSRQRFENQQIVRQEILSERSEITTGKNPPIVKLSLPEQVKAGQDFYFDAIVEEPLGNDLLLGTASEEPVKADGFVNPTTLDLELLAAGGIFKVGRAPLTGENRWISAVLVRHDGITLVTQRLRVEGGRGSSAAR